MRNGPLTRAKVQDAIRYARETWRNDGAEGETVHLLCDAIEQMEALAHCSWCGDTVTNTPGAMVEHLLKCERRATSHESALRQTTAALEAAVLALAGAPCRWPDGAPQTCTEGDPCLTHEMLGHPRAPSPPIGTPREGGSDG